MKKFYEAPEMVIESVDCADVVTTSTVIEHANKECFDEAVDNFIDASFFN